MLSYGSFHLKWDTEYNRPKIENLTESSKNLVKGVTYHAEKESDVDFFAMAAIMTLRQNSVKIENSIESVKKLVLGVIELAKKESDVYFCVMATIMTLRQNSVELKTQQNSFKNWFWG